MSSGSFSMKRSFFLLGLLLLVYLLNLRLDVMEVDAAQYASIAREMWETSSYLEVYHRGQDYLDKPPLLFWLSSAMFHLTGPTNVGYKLPALLALLLGLWATYQFTKTWYSEKIARWATWMTGTCQAYLLMTNDIRTDGLLTGFLMVAFWQISRYLKYQATSGLIWAAVAVGMGMLAKGPIALILFGAGVGTHLLMSRDWRNLFHLQWIPFLALVGLLLIPMCYGLYHQFDLHPEKEVYGLKGPSGLRFFFWTQSFGRITGEIYWENDTSFFYFFHTILWDFQPWVFLFIPALFTRLSSVRKGSEWITIGAFLLGFLALSTSRYKLPHYIFPLLPLASILTATFLNSIPDRTQWMRGLGSVYHVLFILLLISCYFFFKPITWLIPVGIVAGWALFSWWLYSGKFSKETWLQSVGFASVFFGLMMSLYIYPSVLPYQSETQVGKEIKKGQWPSNFGTLGLIGHSLDFYAQRIIPQHTSEEILTLPEHYHLYVDQGGLEAITRRHRTYTIRATYDDYHVTALTLPFLMATTRKTRVQPTYVISLGPATNASSDVAK